MIRRASNKDSLRRGFNNAGRCHSVSWIKAKKVADYPPKAPGQWPAAWFPSSKNPWWQRDLGADDETVGFVRIRPSGAPRDGQRPNYQGGKYTNPNAKGIFTTGRVGDMISYDQQGDGWSQKREDGGWGRTSCRSGFLFKGDSCVDVRDGRGREQGIYEGDWGNEGYEVTVSDKPCTSEGYVWAACAGGPPNSKACCVQAARAQFGDKVVAGRSYLVKGSWNHLPKGCSVSASNDWSAHWNSKEPSTLSASYPPVTAEQKVSATNVTLIRTHVGNLCPTDAKTTVCEQLPGMTLWSLGDQQEMRAQRNDRDDPAAPPYKTVLTWLYVDERRGPREERRRER